MNSSLISFITELALNNTSLNSLNLVKISLFKSTKEGITLCLILFLVYKSLSLDESSKYVILLLLAYSYISSLLILISGLIR